LEVVAGSLYLTYCPAAGNKASHLLEMMGVEIDSQRSRDGLATPAEGAKPSGGIYSLPVVGIAAARVRLFYDEMAPKETESTEMRVAKEVFRWSSAVAGASAVAVIVL
jgi:hypothetical protein